MSTGQDIAIAAAMNSITASANSIAPNTGTAIPIAGALPPATAVAVANAANDPDDDEAESEGDSEIDSDDESIDSFGTDSSDLVARYWEQEGALLHHQESSYLDEDRMVCAYLRSDKIIYDRCKPAELKQFVHTRLLQDPYPQGITLKYYYIRVLEKADREYRFRFLDLPPELRLLICRELLLYCEPSGFAQCVGEVYPAILQTCRQLYQEAKDILYEDNTFGVTFAAAGGEFGTGAGRSAVVHNKTAVSHCPHTRYLRVPKGIDDYPEFFRRISCLEVRLEFEADGQVALLENATWPLNHYIYTLASFLMDGHRLKTLIVKLDISSVVDDSQYGLILYPLRRLRNVSNVVIEGHVPNNVKTKLTDDLKSNEPAFNTLRHWSLIADETRAQLDLHLATHDAVECNCGECMPDCVEELSARLDTLNILGKDSCFSSLLEDRFMVHLHYAREYLHRNDVNQLEALVQEILRKRAALDQYEAVSDDGKLAETVKIWTGQLHKRDWTYNPEDDWSESFDGTAVEKMEDVAEKTKDVNEITTQDSDAEQDEALLDLLSGVH